MSLLRLSRAFVALSLVSMLVLMALYANGHNTLRQQQQDVTELRQLQSHVEHFSFAASSLLLFDAEPGVWAAFNADAARIREDLSTLGQRYPDARKAEYRVQRIMDALQRARATRQPPPEADHTYHGGTLALNERARIILADVSSQTQALKIALDNALSARHTEIERATQNAAITFAAAALLFATGTFVGFGLLAWRLRRPVKSLMTTIGRLRDGDGDARATVSGRDELAKMADALNDLAQCQQDNTRRFESQSANLLHHRRMLDDAQALANAGSWQYDLRDETMHWSDQMFRICGLDPESDTPDADTLDALVVESDRASRTAEIQAALAEDDTAAERNTSHEIEFHLRSNDGSVRALRERIRVSRDAQGSPRLLTGSVQDVTEYWAAKSRMRQYRALFEESDTLLAIVDTEDRLVQANLAYAEFFGMRQEELGGRALADVVGNRHYQNELQQRIARCREHFAPESYETSLINAQDESRQLIARCTPLRDAASNDILVATVITDVTALRVREAELGEKTRLVNIAGRTARLGGWAITLADRTVAWSEITCEIHGMPQGYQPSFDEAIDFYIPEHRERISTAFAACANGGVPYDLQLQIVDAHDQHKWVRTIGQAIRDSAGNITGVHGAFQDISAAKAAEQEIRHLAESLTNTLESITDGFFTLTKDWRFNYVNAEAERLLERDRGDLEGKNIWQAFPEAADGPIRAAYERAVKTRESVSLESFYAPLGRWVDIQAYPSGDGLTVYFRDVSERHQLIERLESQETFLRNSRRKLADALNIRQALINALPAHIALLDGEGNILDVNEQWRHFGAENDYNEPDYGTGTNYLAVCDNATGDCAEEAADVAEGLRAVLSGNRPAFALEYPCHAPDQKRWFRVMANRLPGDGTLPETDATAVVMHVDITERKLAEEQLRLAAYQDSLTGLASRTGFVQALQASCDETGWQQGAALVMFDVERLHDVNDSHGYNGGDRLLVLIADRIRAAMPEGAMGARVGGDEFAVFVPGDQTLSPAESLHAVEAVFAEPFHLDEISLGITARFGFTAFGDTPRDVEAMLHESELALFHARESEVTAGKSAHYDDSLDAASRKRIVLTQALRTAVEHDELELHFQPKVRIATGELVGAEALLRWEHPELGLQSPGVFIPIAEQSQLIRPIGEWVVNRACQTLREWQDAGLGIVRIAVNVSMVQFMASDFVGIVSDALSRHGVPASNLCLEVTESVFSQQSGTLKQRLMALHELGVQLSLDDFGTGYSSLLYLQQYPFDEIKIDQGFTRRVIDDAYSQRIVSSVLNLADALDAKVVAEGVESREIGEALQDMGCEIAQGFYYSMPLITEDFRWLLEKRSSLPLIDTPAAKRHA